MTFFSLNPITASNRLPRAKFCFLKFLISSQNATASFTACPSRPQVNTRRRFFFELLAEGKMTLLCREALEYRNYPSSFYYYGSTTRLVLVNKFFLLSNKGNIEPFVGKRNDLIYLMGNQGEPVEKYMKSNKLNVDDKYEFAQIVTYYNSLFQ